MRFLSDRDEAAIRDMLIWFRSNRTPPSNRPPVTPRTVYEKPKLLAQAPSGGVPARVLATPGEATVEAVIRATEDGIGYFEGDLVKTGDQFTVVNWTHTILGSEGDRVIHVEGHFNGALVLGADACDNDGDPNDIKTNTGAIP